MTDWILHNELSHLVLLKPQHAKLWFLPTLQQVGIWSTKIHYLDVRTALQAETKCMIKEVSLLKCVLPPCVAWRLRSRPQWSTTATTMAVEPSAQGVLKRLGTLVEHGVGMKIGATRRKPDTHVLQRNQGFA